MISAGVVAVLAVAGIGFGVVGIGGDSDAGSSETGSSDTGSGADGATDPGSANDDSDAAGSSGGASSAGASPTATGTSGEGAAPEAGLAAVPLGPAPGEGPGRTAAERATAFLGTYEQGGRLVRIDLGGDTTSDGQALGMLLAVSIDDQERFDRIWGWTTASLQRADGLFAARWQDGAVVDDRPTAGATLDTARALAVAGETFGRPELTAAAVELGARVLDRMTVTVATGRILMPWPDAPAADASVYNPSYASPAAFALLGSLSGDARWAELTAGTRAVTAALTADGALPSEWAVVTAAGGVEPVAGPNGEAGDAQYGADAGRLLVHFAEACEPADVDLAAALLPALLRTGTGVGSAKSALALDGSPLTEAAGPAASVARAAAHSASGDFAWAEAELHDADGLAQAAPTFAGDAWSALGATVLTGSAISGCTTER